ncbi:hypothetical protein D1AOALGA4SA_6787 [Olavius algarvensis Delta 1 endosymbiont]|nr:hypothetical protein D1AOALGA4SA_6787 [Olavius algarvensis Delta 1 endosymbiont]
MFAQDLCYGLIEYFRNAIDSNLKDRAPCRVAAGGDLWGRSSKSEAPSLKRYNKSSIFNSPDYRDPRYAATGLLGLGFQVQGKSNT